MRKRDSSTGATKTIGVRLTVEQLTALDAVCEETGEFRSGAATRGVVEWLAQGGGDVSQVRQDVRAARRLAKDLLTRLSRVLWAELERIEQGRKSGHD